MLLSSRAAVGGLGGALGQHGGNLGAELDGAALVIDRAAGGGSSLAQLFQRRHGVRPLATRDGIYGRALERPVIRRVVGQPRRRTQFPRLGLGEVQGRSQRLGLGAGKLGKA